MYTLVAKYLTVLKLIICLAHGSFVRGIRITALQPIFLEVNDDFHFGASTRKYVIRSKLDNNFNSEVLREDVNLPEKDSELDVSKFYVVN